MTAKLHITDGQKSWDLTLAETPLFIGRDTANNHVVLNDATVSRTHAMIHKKGQTYHITDLDSRNGVRVNGQRLESNQSYSLKNGSCIELGTAKLIYKSNDDLSSRIITTPPFDPNLGIRRSSADKYAKVHSLVQAKKPQLYTPEGDEFVELRSQHFRIRFFIKRHADWLPAIYRTLERAYERVGRKLDYYPRTVPVEVYATNSQFKKMGKRVGKDYAEWAAAVYDGIIRIQTSTRALPAPEDLYIILTHEYVHLAVDEKTDGRCPFWLNEGIAQTESEVLMPKAVRTLIDAIESNALIPLKQLEQPFATLSNERLIRLAYLESHAAVEWLVNRYDWSHVCQLLEVLPNQNSVEAALGTIGLDYKTLESMWQRWVIEKRRQI